MNDQVTHMYISLNNIYICLILYVCLPPRRSSHKISRFTSLKVTARADQKSPQGPPGRRQPGNRYKDNLSKMLQQKPASTASTMWCIEASKECTVSQCLTSNRLMITAMAASSFPSLEAEEVPGEFLLAFAAP